MYTLFYILSAITIIISIICFITRIFRNKKENMVFNTQYFWVVDIVSIFFSILLSAFCYQKEDTETLVIFAMITFLGLMGCIVWYNEIIIFEEKQFTVRNFLGFKRTYPYNEVTGFYSRREKHKNTTLITTYFYAGNKKFSVLTSARNYAEFFAKLCSVYKKYNNGKTLPKLTKKGK